MNSSEYDDYGLLWIKQTDGPGLCFEDQHEALQTSRKKLTPPREALIKAGRVKNFGVVSKTLVGNKCPLKTVVPAVDEKAKAIESIQSRAPSWWRPSRGWEARVECWLHGEVARKYKDINELRTTMNEEQQWMNNIDQHHRNLSGGFCWSCFLTSDCKSHQKRT